MVKIVKCQKCGKKYPTYPVIIDDNPLSIASYLEEGNLCKKCRGIKER